MKRAISLSFLLFASMILLAHFVVPHHRHHVEKGVCFADFFCKDSDNDNHNHNEHEKSSLPNGCCIDVYIHAGKNIKPACRFHKKCDCGQTIHVLVLTPLHTHDFVDDAVICFRQNPLVPLIHSVYISQSLGLRAPPVC